MVQRLRNEIESVKKQVGGDASAKQLLHGGRAGRRVMVARHSGRSQLLALGHGWKARLPPCIKEGMATSVSAHQRRSLGARICCDSRFLAGEASCELLSPPAKVSRKAKRCRCLSFSWGT